MVLYEASFLGEPTPVPQKKPRTRKVPAPVVPVEPVVPVPAAPVAVLPPKKRVRKPKVPPPPSEDDGTIDLEVDHALALPIKPKPKPQKAIVASEDTATSKPKAKRAKKVVIENGTQTTDEPPLWFKRWHEDELKRKNASKTKKERDSIPVIKAAATEIANKQWNDEFTRDKLNNDVNNHMNRLYSQIHGKKF